jgi:hypothetical protein
MESNRRRLRGAVAPEPKIRAPPEGQSSLTVEGFSGLNTNKNASYSLCRPGRSRVKRGTPMAQARSLWHRCRAVCVPLVIIDLVILAAPSRPAWCSPSCCIAPMCRLGSCRRAAPRSCCKSARPAPTRNRPRNICTTIPAVNSTPPVIRISRIAHMAALRPLRPLPSSSRWRRPAPQFHHPRTISHRSSQARSSRAPIALELRPSSLELIRSY